MRVEIDVFVRVAKAIVAAGMTNAREALLYGPNALNITVKDDKSLLTEVDQKNEEIARSIIESYKLDVYFWGEETGQSGNPNARYVVFVDPIDGSRPFANRHLGGSTVICSFYDTQEKQIVVSIIGCPGTGEVWLAIGRETYRYLYSYEHQDWDQLNRCRVWEYDPAVARPTVYVDNPNPFTRSGATMLTADNLDKLDSLFRQNELTKFVVGSNGLHHALVASGGPVIGSITTSIGGLQDLGGIKIVQNAGGVVRAFVLDPTDHSNIGRVDPVKDLLVAGGYDFLICAIDDARADQLERLLGQSLEG